jgi:hypothetical protein
MEGASRALDIAADGQALAPPSLLKAYLHGSIPVRRPISLSSFYAVAVSALA